MRIMRSLETFVPWKRSLSLESFRTSSLQHILSLKACLRNVHPVYIVHIQYNISYGRSLFAFLYIHTHFKQTDVSVYPVDPSRITHSVDIKLSLCTLPELNKVNCFQIR